ETAPVRRDPASSRCVARAFSCQAYSAQLLHQRDRPRQGSQRWTPTKSNTGPGSWIILLCRAHAERANSLPRPLVTQRGQKSLHGGARAPVCDQQEVVVLGRNRQEAEAIEARHRLDRDAPLGTALLHRGSDRIVRPRLVAV